MIGRLRGTLAAKHLDRLVLDVGGVGYEIHVSPRTLADMPSVGEDIVLHTHLHVREDAMVVFGFPTEAGQQMFRVLLGAPGVGPRVALAMLSTLDTDGVHTAIVTEDVDVLATVPGIGKRTAQKIVLELKSKLGDVVTVGSGSHDRSKVREALEGLGYGPSEISDAVAGVPADLSVEDQVRLALRSMGGAT